MARIITETKEETFRLIIGTRPFFVTEPSLHTTRQDVTNLIQGWLTARAIRERRGQFSGNVYPAEHCRAWPDTEIVAGSGERFPVICFEGQVPECYLRHRDSSNNITNYLTELGEFLAQELKQRFFQISFRGTLRMYESATFTKRLEDSA